MKRKSFIVVGLLVLLSLGLALNFWSNLGWSIGYAPEQPIPFSHKKHAGELQIPCLYCHVNVDKGRHATVPAMNICMNCHTVVKADPNPTVKNDKGEDQPNPNYSPYIQKLREFYKEGKSIAWVKVHDLPDFVFFNHRPHIQKGIDCISCHGDVKQMDRVEQIESLKMGFCMDCHRQNKAPMDCYTCHQ